MKYIALWLGVAAALTVVALILIGGVKLVELVSADPALIWVPLVVAGILAIATLVAVIDYLSDQRPTPPAGPVVEP